MCPDVGPASGGEASLEESAFMRACRGLPADRTPVWLMRQAGRYMKEYREVREKVPFLELCGDSDLAAEVTVTAAERIGADAAIIFSDILLILQPMGMDLEYAQGDGPILHNPVRSEKDLERLREVEPAESLSFVYEAVSKTRAQLSADTPLIGFCGAPFTLASYMIEGGGSRNFEHTKRFMYTDEVAWNALMEKLTRSLAKYLNGQILAGAQAVQIFDSWVGCLGPEDYRRFVMPHSRALIGAVSPGVPVIHFGTGTAPFLEAMREAGGDVIGIDFRVDLASARDRLGKVAVQGNLDPCVLFAERDYIRKRAEDILAQGGRQPGHIFNLGHGVLPATSVDSVKFLIDTVHEWRGVS